MITYLHSFRKGIMFKNHFFILFKWKIYKFDEKPLKIRIKDKDLNRIFTSMYYAIFSYESEAKIYRFFGTPLIYIYTIYKNFTLKV